MKSVVMWMWYPYHVLFKEQTNFLGSSFNAFHRLQCKLSEVWKKTFIVILKRFIGGALEDFFECRQPVGIGVVGEDRGGRLYGNAFTFSRMSAVKSDFFDQFFR
jgi:hypothetical protein